MNIVVLAGGLSTERDVSLITGKGVCEALCSKGHKAVLLDAFLGYGKKGDDLSDVFEKDSLLNEDISAVGMAEPDIEKIKKLRGKETTGFFGENVLDICRMADIVFMALHGAEGEDGKVQAAFDLLGIRYTGTGYLGSAIAMDKSISKKLFETDNIPTPVGVSMGKNDIKKIPCGMGYPCVVKPCSGGSSVGVSIANDEEEFFIALDAAFKYEDEVIVEEYIKGREFSVGVLAGKSLPVIEIIPKEGFYDYKTKYQPGMADDVCPAEITEEQTEVMQKYALRVYNLLKLETYARIDFLLDEKGGIYCLEANTLPGMTPTSLIPQEAKAEGMDYASLCEFIVNDSLN